MKLIEFLSEFGFTRIKSGLSITSYVVIQQEQSAKEQSRLPE
jgi:hypothetical protein